MNGQPIGRVLGGLEILPLPQGTEPRGLIGFVKLAKSGGGIGWVVRVTKDIDDEETLGMLVGYIEHLKQVAAESWEDADPTS